MWQAFGGFLAQFLKDLLFWITAEQLGEKRVKNANLEAANAKLKKMRKLTRKAKMIAAVAALAFMTACASNTGSLESCTAPPQYTTEQMEQAWAESQAVPEDGMMMMIFFDMLDLVKKYYGGNNDTP